MIKRSDLEHIEINYKNDIYVIYDIYDKYEIAILFFPQKF